MLYAQRTQFLYVAKQLAIDVIEAVVRPARVDRPLPGYCGLSCASTGAMSSGSLAKRPTGRHAKPGW